MADVTGDIPEDLNCPICFEIPLDKVFQCEEGHTLCEQCYLKLKECPQCKVPFGLKPIRNRAVERMLENYRCPFRTTGCTAIAYKKARNKHLETCIFNESKFGTLLSICENFGVSKCPFKMNKMNIQQALKHLQSEHQIIISDSELILCLPEFSKMVQMSKKDGLNLTSQAFILKKYDYAAEIKLILSNDYDGTYSLSFKRTTFPYSGIGNYLLLTFAILNEAMQQRNEDPDWSILPVNDAIAGVSKFKEKITFAVGESEAPASVMVAIKLRDRIDQYAGLLMPEAPLILPLSEFSSSTDAVAQAKAETEAIMALMESDGKLYQERVQSMEIRMKQDEEEINTLRNKLEENSQKMKSLAKPVKLLTVREVEKLLSGTYRHDPSRDTNDDPNLSKYYLGGLVKSYDGEVVSWGNKNGYWTQTSVTRRGKHEISFKFNEEFEEAVLGKPGKSVITFNGMKLVHRLEIDRWRFPFIIKREFTDFNNELIVTFEQGLFETKRFIRK